MDAQDIRNLQEAYMNVCEAKVDKKLPEHERSGTRLNRYDNPSGALALGGGQQRARREEHKERRGVKKEQVDLYDIILSHLIDEGYAETPEAAEVIMVNMSEGWRESIVEEVLKEGKKEFPETKVREKAAKHEEDYIKKRNPKSMSRARKMKAIASTVEVGDDPRNTMHGQDLRKIR